MWALWKNRKDLIYIHSDTSLLRISLLTIGRVFSKKIILTLHAYPVIKNKFQKSIDEFFYNLADTILVVNSEIQDHISLHFEKCIVEPAFLPPVMGIESDLPANVSDWITIKKNSEKLIISANAWQLKIFNNQDLYGLDMCIDVACI